MNDFPETLDDDSESVAIALEVGRAMWARGDRRDALKWLRKAIDDAFDAGDDERGLSLSKRAALLAPDPSLAPPAAADAVAPLELPSRASAVPEVPLREATGRFAALRNRTVPPPEFGGAAARILRGETPVMGSLFPPAVTSTPASPAASLAAPAPAAPTIAEPAASPAARPVSQPPAPMPVARVPLVKVASVRPQGPVSERTRARSIPPPASRHPIAERLAASLPVASRANDDASASREAPSPSSSRVSRPPPSRASRPPERPRGWSATTALRVALGRSGDAVTARLLDADEMPRVDEVEATVLAPGADEALQALFASRLVRTG